MDTSYALMSLADVYDFGGPPISSLERQLDSQIGEKGINLSGGEKQRIAISRALMREPDLLVLDEPSSALDPITEQEIFKLVQELTVDKTAIIVSHRLSAVTFADRVLVLKDGKIVEEGSHSDLIAKKEVYYGLFQQQINKETLYVKDYDNAES